MFNDLDLDFSENLAATQAYLKDKRNQRKIKEATDSLRGNLHLMNPLREGKKLLVLDIDYSTSLPVTSSLSYQPVLCSSDPGYEALIRRITSVRGMCATPITPVPRNDIPLLRYLYMVRPSS